MHGGRHGRGRAGARDISPVSPTNPSPPALAGLFAEGPGDRRDRLTQIMVDRNIATAATSGMTEEESRKSKEETSDVWYHEGPPQLADARKAIAGYSLARARDRLKEARLRLARPDRTVRARRTQQHADLRVRRNDCRCCCGATMTASGCVYRSPCPHPDLTPTSPRPQPDLLLPPSRSFPSSRAKWATRGRCPTAPSAPRAPPSPSPRGAAWSSFGPCQTARWVPRRWRRAGHSGACATVRNPAPGPLWVICNALPSAAALLPRSGAAPVQRAHRSRQRPSLAPQGAAVGGQHLAHPCLLWRRGRRPLLESEKVRPARCRLGRQPGSGALRAVPPLVLSFCAVRVCVPCFLRSETPIHRLPNLGARVGRVAFHPSGQYLGATW